MATIQYSLPDRITIRLNRLVKTKSSSVKQAIVVSAVEEYLDEMESDVMLKHAIERDEKIEALVHQMDAVCDKIDVRKIPFAPLYGTWN